LKKTLVGLLLTAALFGCGGGGGGQQAVGVCGGSTAVPSALAKTVASEVTIILADSGSYTIQGINMDGVVGINLTINYDSASLSSPTVALGSLVTGALMAANTNSPGSIKIVIITTKAFSGSGPIASISFGSQKGTGGITLVSTNLINDSGTSVPGSASSSPATSPSSGISSNPSSPTSTDCTP